MDKDMTVDDVSDKLKNQIVVEYLDKINKISKGAKSRAIQLRKDIKKRTATAISAAFSFLIALFWRDAITDVINKILSELGLSGSTYIAKIITALFVTALGVIAINHLSKWGEK